VGWRIGVLYAGFGVLAMIGNGVKAADRFWIAAAETNWNNASHWSTVSGGAGGAGVPGSADRAIFDTGGAGNCLLDVAINLQGLRLESDYAGVVVQSGTGDQHNPLFSGTVDWPRLAKILAGSAYTGPVSMEVTLRNSGIEDETAFLGHVYTTGLRLSKMIEDGRRGTEPTPAGPLVSGQ